MGNTGTRGGLRPRAGRFLDGARFATWTPGYFPRSLLRREAMPTIKNLLPGSPEPLGPTVEPDGINFAIHSAGATRIELLLFDNIADQRPSQVIPLAPETNRTGDVWPLFVEGLPNETLYNIRADGPYEPARDGSRYNVHKTLLD